MKEIGLVLGELRTKCHTVRNVCKHMSISDIVNILKYEEHFVKKVVSLLQEYPDATDDELVELLKKESE